MITQSAARGWHSCLPISERMSLQRHILYKLPGSRICIAVVFATGQLCLHRFGEALCGRLAVTWLLPGYFTAQSR